MISILGHVGHPTQWTFSRILSIVPCVGLTLAAAAYGGLWCWIAAAAIAVAGITDYFDGEIARSQKLTSVLGAKLDLFADKAFTVALLGTFLYLDYIYFGLIAYLIIAIREILVSTLRELVVESDDSSVKSLEVMKIAKWKTTVQFASFAILPLGELHIYFLYVGNFVLWFAVVITAITGYFYYAQVKRMDLLRWR